MSRGRLPDFLIIGAQKSGTTSLQFYLQSHPDIGPNVLGEPHFFDWAWKRGVDWYRDLFAELDPHALVGEKSPFYLFHPQVPERVASTVPDARLVAILRDPVDRALSHYFHAVRWHNESRPIEEAFKDEEGAVNQQEDPRAYDEQQSDLVRHSYLRRGLYAEQLERWLQYFPPSQLLVLETRELTRSGPGGFHRVLDFLGLERKDPPRGEFNRGSYDDVGHRLRDHLSRFFRPHNQKLFHLVGREWDWN